MKMKKFLSILLALTLVIGLLPAIGIFASASNATTWKRLDNIAAAASSDKQILITMTVGGETYALKNIEKSPVVATSVNGDTITILDSDGAAADIGWTITETAAGSNKYHIKNGTNYLYMINDNNGVKVGSTSCEWYIASGYLTAKDTFGNIRNIGVYSATNWRSYKYTSNTVGNNIKGQTLNFWEYTGTGSATETPATPATIAEALTETDSAKKLAITGVITFIDGANFYIQDSTGTIRVNSTSTLSIEVGKTYIFTGTIGTHYNELKRLNCKSAEPASSSISPVAVEKAVSEVTFNDFSKYIKVTGTVSIVDDGNGSYATANITLTDGDGKTVYIYKAAIDKTTVAVGDTLTVTGTVDQANNSPRIRTHSADQFILSKHTSHSNEDNEIESDNDNHWKVCDICGATYDSETHTDTATPFHKCDICNATTSQCKDEAAPFHKCDICNATTSECKDEAAPFHKCDICSETTSSCSDKADDGDHKCDLCDQAMADAACADGEDEDHNCDDCNKSLCSDADNDGNHKCDVCDKDMPSFTHPDVDNNKYCDECNANICAEHIDEDNGVKDHKCNLCNQAMGGECVAAEGKHTCDYCGATKSECKDETPKDHKCDICQTAMGGDCVAAEGTHACEYCGATKSECSDSATDKDHKCDVCGKDDMNDHDWEDATTEAPKTCKICGKTEGEPLAPTGAGLITDISKLKDGDKIVIIATGANKGLSTNQKSNNRGTVAVVKTGNTVDLPEELQVFEVDILDNGKFTLKCVNGDTAGKYIYGGETSNRLKSSDTVDDKGTWTITISADGVATIKSIAGNRDWLRYNNASNDLFACYASGQQDVSIYKLGYAGDAPQEVQATETNVAGIKNAANGDKLQIKGIVTNVYYTTIYIQDETGAVKVVLGANFPGKIGDVIVVTGNKNSDGSIVSATYEASSGMTLTAKETTAANLSTLDIGTYVKIAGLTVSKINLNDDDKITSIEFNAGSVTLVTSGTILTDDDIKVGDTVTITGTNAGDNKVWNVSYVVTTAGTGNEGGNTGNEGGNTGNEGGNTGNEGGNTGNEGGNTGNEGTTTPVTKPTLQANPVVGSKYIFGMKQVKKNVTLYFSGEMDGYYLATTEDPAKAVEVQMESVEGGYRLFFMKDGKKTYIDIIPRDNAEGKVNVVLTETPAAVYTYNKDLKTFTTKVVDKEWYLGTYNDFTTFSASETWRITGDNASAADSTQYIAHMYAMTTTNVPSNGDTALSTIVALFVISAMGVVALVAKKKEF